MRSLYLFCLCHSSLSHCPCRSVSLCLYISVALCLSPWPFLSVSLCFSRSVFSNVSMTLSLSVCLSVSLMSLRHSWSLWLSVCVFSAPLPLLSHTDSEQKVLLIFKSDAVVDNAAVVVHFHYTIVTDFT